MAAATRRAGVAVGLCGEVRARVAVSAPGAAGSRSRGPLSRTSARTFAVAATQGSIAVVTGAGSGIGRALSLALVARGLRVVAVGRRRAALEGTQEKASALPAGAAVDVVPADVGTKDGRQAVTDHCKTLVDSGLQLAYIVQNAGSLGEVGSPSTFSVKGFQAIMASNVEGPLFLTQALQPMLQSAASATGAASRVLHISSGAAHSPLPGWLPYCTSKAAMLQLMRCLDKELAPQVRVGSAMPGVVDTDMQAHIRSLDFASVGYFKSLKNDEAQPFIGKSPPPRGRLDSPENVADFLSWLVLDVDEQSFGGREWDINNTEDQRQWLSAQG